MTEAQRQIVGEYYYVLCLKLSAHTCHSCKLPGRWVGGRGGCKMNGCVTTGAGVGGMWGPWHWITAQVPFWAIMGCCGHIVKMIWPNRNDLISAPWLISHFVLWQCSDARPGGTKWPVKWRLMQFDFRVIRCRARTRQKCREKEMERERKRKQRGANCF